MKYRYSLILPTYNRKKEVGNFLSSIVKSNYNLSKVQIIILDQNDCINLEDIINNYKCIVDIIYIKSTMKGLSVNRNIGLQYADGEIIAFPDDDCMYLNNTLAMVDDFFCKNKNISLVAGKIVDKRGRDSLRKWPKKQMVINKFNFYNKCSSITTFVKLNKENINFNEKLGAGTYFGSCEDVDFIFRYLNVNKSIPYLPQISVYHPNHIDILPNKTYSYGLGFGAFCKENLQISTIILFLESISIHFIRLLISLLELDKKRALRSYLSILSRLKGFIQY